MNSGLQLGANGFSLVNAQRLAQASAEAYLPAEGGGTRTITDAGTDTHVCITAYDDCTVIAFRGTRDLRNWITDAEIRLRSIGVNEAATACASRTTVNPRVHEGFFHAIDAVIDEIAEQLGKPPVIRRPPLLITGHSLGGALAVLCAWMLERRGIEVHSVYTFGQPRVGDRQFAAAYDASLGGRTFRIVNQNDIVPRLPGRLMGFRHAGQCVFINVAGGLQVNPSLVSMLISDGLGLWRAYRRVEDVLISDHLVSHYLNALKAPDAD